MRKRQLAPRRELPRAPISAARLTPTAPGRVARRWRAAYDHQLRGPAAYATTPGAVLVQEGPALRVTGLPGGGMVMARGLRSLDRFELTSLIQRQQQVFAALQQPFEWKTWRHDQPAEFPRRLLELGFTEGESEEVMVAPVAPLAREVAPPDGVVVRQLRTEADFARLATHLGAVWHREMAEEAEAHRRAVQAFPELVTVLAALAGDTVVSSARAEVVPGTDFCGLWGGSTLESWRGRGLYRMLLARRALLARLRGSHLLQVDALPSSRPILARLGFVTVATSTPFHWSPPEPD